MGRSGLVRQASACIAMLAIVTVVLGFGYPLAVTGISQLFFRHQANGSLVYVDGTLKGSALLGQNFTAASGAPLSQYFQPRPSDAGTGYDGSSSGASNLGPSNPVLINEVTQRATAYRQFNHMAPNAPVPVDAVTASGSGLDPDISLQNALDQALGIHCAVGTQVHKAVGGARLAGGNPGDIVSQHIEAPNFYGALKLLQPPRQQRLG